MIRQISNCSDRHDNVYASKLHLSFCVPSISCFTSENLQDGHVEVARLLLDSGAQVNMPADSFESPLTLAACGGHVELAALLIERGANLEEVNDEGYTPLMEAAREGHEEMVALLLAQGKVVLLL